MAEKKKGKRRKDEYVVPGEQAEKPSKDEYNIGKWLRKNVPIKKTKFLNHNVEYFTGSRAVDSLLESEFAQGDDALFKTRLDVVNYLNMMLIHKFFHRARKVPVSEQELKSKRKDKKVSDDEKKKEGKKEKGKGTDAESSVVEGKIEVVPEKEKRKRKVRLEMHIDQQFVDCLDAYVWIYDPIPFYYWIFGAFLVLGAIGICLFPLWPPSVRLGVYYLSVAAAGFLVFIIFLVVFRLIIFCIVWVATIGKHHIWILPNLTEDVGFFASFWPLYKYAYKGGDSSQEEEESKKDKKKKKKLKDKDSDGEEDVKNDEKMDGVSESESTLRHRNVSKQTNDGDRHGEGDGGGGASVATISGEGGGSTVETVNAGGESESESESSQRSSTGKDFEIVDQDDLDES
ncbi:Trp1 [Trypoxylus dichotomus]